MTSTLRDLADEIRALDDAGDESLVADEGARWARRAPRESRTTEIGLELRCGHCDEFWPADSQFYYRNARSGDGWHSWCRACCDTSVRAKRAGSGKHVPHHVSPAHDWKPLLAWSQHHAGDRA